MYQICVLVQNELNLVYEDMGRYKKKDIYSLNNEILYSIIIMYQQYYNQTDFFVAHTVGNANSQSGNYPLPCWYYLIMNIAVYNTIFFKYTIYD